MTMMGKKYPYLIIELEGNKFAVVGPFETAKQARADKGKIPNAKIASYPTKNRNVVAQLIKRERQK